MLSKVKQVVENEEKYLEVAAQLYVTESSRRLLDTSSKQLQQKWKIRYRVLR